MAIIPDPNLPRLNAQPDGTVAIADLNSMVRSIESWAQMVTAALTPRDIPQAGFVASAGWSVAYAHGFRLGSLVILRVIAQRTGGAIAVPANGIVGLTSLMKAPAALRGPTVVAATISTGGVGRVAVGVYTPSDGNILLAAVDGGGGNIAVGETIELGGVAIVEGI